MSDKLGAQMRATYPMAYRLLMTHGDVYDRGVWHVHCKLRSAKETKEMKSSDLNSHEMVPPYSYTKAQLKSHAHTLGSSGVALPCAPNAMPDVPLIYKRWMAKYLPDPRLVRRTYDVYWMLDFIRYARALKKRFNNIHSGRAAILVGSGPSVCIKDLERFTGFVSFACNRFYLCYDRTSFRPTYVVSADPTMIEDHADLMIQKSQCPVFFNTSERVILSGKNAFWIPSIIPHRAPLKFQTIIYKGLFCGGGSLISALQIGYYMGIRRFYLYGVDHDFAYQKVDAGDAARSAIGDGNHFIENYRDGKPWFPPATKRIEESFIICDRFLREQGGFVKNATRGGKLDVLERIDMEAVLSNEKDSSVERSRHFPH